MSKTLRIRKNGERVYELRIFRGRDPETGKQLTSYSTVFHIPPGISDAQAEIEADKAEQIFRKRCEAGLVSIKKESRKKPERNAELPNHPTFQEYAQFYLKQLAVDHAPGTVVSYRQSLERACSVFGSRKLEKITAAGVKGYLSSMRTDDRLKHSTCNYHFTILQLLFKSAVEEGVLAESPMKDLRRPRKSKEERYAASRADKFYDEKEVSYLLECMEQEPLKWKALVTFMLDSGCRRAELAGLRWSDIDLETGRTRICNTLQYSKELGVYDTSTKSGKNREIFLNEQAIAVMREWKVAQMQDYPFPPAKNKDYCFPNEDGSGMNPGMITQYFRRFGRRYDLPHFHPHTLRHTMASLSILNGADVVSVSQKLGHANVSTTLNIYSHANEETQRRASRILGDVIYKNTAGHE